MGRESFHVDGTVGAGRAKGLASAAADALLDVDGRDLGRVWVVGVGGYHQDGGRRAMAGAVVALHPVGQRDAEVFPPDGLPDLDGRLLGEGDGLYGAGGADLGALHALGPAIAPLVAHLWLHQFHQVRAGAKDLIRADRDAELAGRTVLGEMACAQGASRDDRGLSFGLLLVDEDCQATVDCFLHFLSLHRRRGGYEGRGRQEAPTCLIGFRFTLAVSRGGFRGMDEMDGVLMAFVKAIHAGHAAAVVDPMVGDVDAGGLAILGAELAVDALLGVDDRLEVRELGQEAEHRSHRADRVAISPPAAPCQDRYYNKGKEGDEESGQALEPDRRLVERVVVRPLGQVGQKVIAPLVKRGEQVAGDPSIRAVGREQGDHRTDTRDERHHEHRQHPVAPPRLGRRVGIPVFLFLLAQPSHDVLRHAKRTNHGAINPPEDERQYHEAHDDPHVQRQRRWQELDLRQPA